MNPCTRAEAYKIVTNAGGFKNLQPEDIKRLRTLSDDDLTALNQSMDFFSLNEANRRYFLALHRESRRTTWLTVGVLILSVVLVVLAAAQTWPTSCPR